MNYFYDVLALLAGLGVFLLGVKLLSDNIEKLANNNIRRMFNKVANSKLAGVFIGTVVTALLQSSSTTTVLVVGFVNSGIMSLLQATTVIMGANIGTTITSQIAALEAYKLSDIAIALAGIGMFINLFSKKESSKILGNLLTGLGIIFVGLNLMSDSMAGFRESAYVKDLLVSLENPFILFLVGVVFTGIIQSSSAATTLVVTLVGSGLVIGSGGNEVLFVILGTNIGTCVTALISSIGTQTNAKRAAVIHLLFNFIGSGIFFIVLLVWKDFMAVTFGKLFSNPETQIAMFHTFFNVVCTCLFVFFAEYFVKASKIIIKDNNQVKKSSSYLDKRFLSTPAVALSSVVAENCKLIDRAVESLNIAVAGFIKKDTSKVEDVMQINDEIEEHKRHIIDYLIQISSMEINLDDEKEVTKLHSTIGDAVRVSELAENITKYNRKQIKENLIFSDTVHTKLKEMLDLINTLAYSSKRCLQEKDHLELVNADAIEERIDTMRKELIKDHITRLNNGKCKPESSSIFINLVCNLERVGDHLIYVAHSIDSI